MSKGYKPTSRDESNFQAECPTPEQRLEQVLKKWKGHKPGMMPSDPFQAARWWISHQEQPDDWHEQAEKVWDGPKFCGWDTPYHDRLEHSLRRFLRMKTYHQAFIVEAVERGIPWRADDIHKYMETVKEADKMLADPMAYKAEHNLILEQFTE